jgi:hypothetical protein
MVDSVTVVSTAAGDSIVAVGSDDALRVAAGAHEASRNTIKHEDKTSFMTNLLV